MSGMDIVKVLDIPAEYCGGDISEVTRIVKGSAGAAYEFVSLEGDVAMYQAPASANTVDGGAVRRSLLAMLGASEYRFTIPSSRDPMFNIALYKWQPPVVAPEPSKSPVKGQDPTNPRGPGEWLGNGR